MLHSSDLEFLMEAHNGIAAKIIQEAGIALFFFFVNLEQISHLVLVFL